MLELSEAQQDFAQNGARKEPTIRTFHLVRIAHRAFHNRHDVQEEASPSLAVSGRKKYLRGVGWVGEGWSGDGDCSDWGVVLGKSKE